MTIGDEVYEAGYSYIPLIVVDEIAESALVKRIKDGSRHWVLKNKLRRG
jgi:hypothetical protein